MAPKQRVALGGPVLNRPDFSVYLRIPGSPEQQQEQMVELVRLIGHAGVTMVDLWLTPLGDDGPEAAYHSIAATILTQLSGAYSVRVARVVAELAAPMIQRNPDFWSTPVGILLIHAGALDFERSFSRIEAARILCITPERVRRLTQTGQLTAVGKTTAVTGASLRQLWLERQIRYQRLDMQQAPALTALKELASELDC